MRAVVQRVVRASVTVDGQVVGGFEDRQGLAVLVGVTHSDDEASADALAVKLAQLRILDGDASVTDTGAPVLVVSQFTLYADTRKGRRPSWHAAAPAAVAEPLVDRVVTTLRTRGVTVSTGRFGAHMLVDMVNDGPVTLLLET